jgi:ABC-type arginine transport system ATPase subunit
MKYKRRVCEVVNAFRYSDPMSQELIELLRRKVGLFFFERNKLYVHTRVNRKRAEIGDMIVELPDGTLDVQKPEIFNMKYERI